MITLSAIISLFKSIITVILVVLGFVVGFLNISQKEKIPFLAACVTLMVASNANYLVIPTVGITLQNILHNIVTFVAPAGIIVALTMIMEFGKR